ncbi:carboxymuconolactone decarboxylase family protein [Amycolatopsis mediterranei]|uniref:carboxymuconolactone decarboxylase family protein n=1 Tax=Amycolatopsis mediterranei TaxID=33910 RepID=UPI00049EEE13|nr:carboxymuconolactone decarboxylase family protein [Amycolatopsis mediterranei]KDO11196.1 alkylhydroperoxidase [Amycolatopsis mediterranei]KDU85931.1 alkylhydroperoxidase [Amycolatopsis mediterranei]UZF73581.1 carboxymuconolactone decarboxylase family protein [Amycolatopsis mediterranei]
MAPGVVRVALRRTLRDVKYVDVVPPRQARGLVREVYRQVERDFGMLAPPVALHSAAPDVLAAAWLMLRESLIAGGTASRADKEVVAAAVSAANSCPYCVEVHGMALGSLGEPDAAAAIAAGDTGGIADRDTRELAAWARGAGQLPADVPAGAVAEFTGVAVTFHYLNRMVSVFLGPSPLPDAVPASARAKAKAVLGFLLKPGAAPPPGEALGLLQASPVAGPDWAPPGGPLAGAFSRAAAAIEAAGERSAAPRVRDLVRRELKAWDGKSPGLSRAWAELPAAELPGSERAEGRLALLVAKAPYQVTSADVVAFGPERTGDRGLLELVSWASHAAALELGGRMPVRPRREDPPRRGGR